MPRRDYCITSPAFHNEIVTLVALGTVTLRVSAYSYAFPIVTRFHLYRSSDNRKEVHTIDTIHWFQLPLPELQPQLNLEVTLSTMPSTDSTTFNCPVCDKELHGKKPIIQINQHIQRAAKSEELNTDPHRFWLEDHQKRDNQRAADLRSANRERVRKWRSKNLELSRQRDQKRHQQNKAKRLAEHAETTAFDLPLREPSDDEIMANPYYLLGLLGVTIRPEAFTVEEVQDSLQRTEQLLGQSASDVCYHQYSLI